MNIYVYTKKLWKESVEVQKAIISSVNILYDRICLYENQNISFQKIFNDDTVKYDKHGDFYTFKIQRSNMQLRILYAYFIINNTPIILIGDYIIKKKNNKQYIRRFDHAKVWEPMEIYKNSFCVM